MKRSLLICLSVLLALVALAATTLAMEGRSAPGPNPVRPTQDETARVAVAHLAPFSTTTAVNIRIDGTPVPQLANFVFGDSTPYIPVATGTHLVEIYVVGGGSPTLAISRTLDLKAQDYTVIAVGGANDWDLDLRLIEDDNTSPPPGTAKVRLGHLAPFAPTITGTLADVRFQDGSPVPGATGVPYGLIGSYTPLPATTYDLKVTAPGFHAVLIDPLPAIFSAGDILSVFAVGDDESQPLGIFVWPSDAQGFFLDLAASVQVAHLAPFAPDPFTSVTVTIDSEVILTNFAFADSTGYLTMTAGVDHLIEVFPPGSESAAISATVNLTHPLEFTAIAIGGANGWDLELMLLEDDNTPPATDQFKIRTGHLAPFTATITETVVDFRRQDGSLVVNDIAYGPTVSPTYASPPAGTYDLKVTSPDGNVILIDPLAVTFDPGDILSMFAVGDDPNQPLGVFVLPSGQRGTLLPLATYHLFLPITAKDATP